jgi:DNA-binding IclR family transcriptional regulator
MDGLGRLVGALSITGPASRLDENRLLGTIAPIVVRQADLLASRLGRAR